MSKKILLIMLLTIIVNSFGALQLRNGRIEPEFAKPGEPITVYVEAVHDYNQPVSIGGVVSENQIWENSNDYLFWYNGGQNKVALNPPVSNLNYVVSDLNQNLEWREYSFTFTVPSSFEEGKTYYLILKGNQKYLDYVYSMTAEDTEIIPMEVASNKGVVYNTAYLGEKKSTAAFIMIAGPPPADLEANPSNGIGNTYIYDKSSIKVGLSTNAVTGATIYYTLNDTEPTSSSTLYTDSITITGDDTLKAIAIVPGFDNTIGEWYYDQQLPEAKLTATPANNSIYTYDTPAIDVKIGTNFGNNIVWQLLDLSDSSVITPWDTTTDSTYTIQVSGDMIISAFTIGNNYTSVDSMWAFDCDLPVLEVVADPSDTTFQMNLKIALFAEYNGSLVDAEIKYIIDSTGQGFQVSDVKTNGIVYTGDKITIYNSVVIYVVAINSDYADGFNSFTYTIDLVGIDITADPSNDPDYKIGDNLDTIKLSSNADSLKWIISGSISDSSDVLQSGVVYDLAGGDFPSIKASDPDTVYLSVVGFGKGQESAYKTFIYVKQTLPNIIANYFDSSGYKFSLPHSDLTLTVPGADSLYENVKIYFYIGDSEFGAYPDSTDSIYNSGIDLNKTMYVKAIAYADNAKKSAVFIGHYILSAGVVHAKYFDDDSNGDIDGVSLDLSMQVTNLPDSIVFESPFNSSEKRTAYSSNMDFNADRDGIIITLNQPFNYNHQTGSTGFEETELGTLYGKYYVESAFSIGDSVAPLIQKGYYKPGEIIKTEPIVERACDTLVLSFSEKIDVSKFADRDVSPAELFQVEETNDYRFELQYLSQKENVCTFKVLSIEGDIVYPKTGDSTKIDYSDEISDSYGNIQSVDKNRAGDLVVFDLPYLLKVKAISPVNPAKEKIPEELQIGNINKENGVLIIADFHMMIPEQDKINVKITIFDQVGTLVASSLNIENGNYISSDIINSNGDNKTRIVIVWDGRNSKGRFVGSGMYIAEIVISDPNGEKIPFSVPIGIETTK